MNPLIDYVDVGMIRGKHTLGCDTQLCIMLTVGRWSHLLIAVFRSIGGN